MLHKLSKSKEYTYIFALIFSISLFLGVNLTGCGTSGTTVPSVLPTVEPTDEPTVEPTDEPTVEPTDEPTVEPTDEPTVEPTDEPTVEPTDEPTVEPTDEPTVEPTVGPTDEPTDEPTVEPTDEPTVEPTDEPTVEPTDEPTVEPTDEPTAEPSDEPTQEIELTGFYMDDKGDIHLDENSWLVKLGYSAVFNSEKYTFTLYKDGNKVTELTIPEAFEYEGRNYRITSIGQEALAYTTITKVNIPGSAAVINERAFEYNSLTELTIPEGVTEIGDYAFLSGNGNYSLNFSGSTLTSIGICAFAYNENLQGDLVLPDSVKEIRTAAFRFTAISSAALPDNLESLGAAVFQDCDNLTSVYWNGNTYTDRDEFNSAVKAAGIATEDPWPY